MILDVKQELEDVTKMTTVSIGQFDIREMLKDAKKRTLLASELRRIASMLECGRRVDVHVFDRTPVISSGLLENDVKIHVSFPEPGEQCTHSSTAGRPSPQSSTSDFASSTSDTSWSDVSSSAPSEDPIRRLISSGSQGNCVSEMARPPCPMSTPPEAARREVHEYYTLIPLQEK